MVCCAGEFRSQVLMPNIGLPGGGAPSNRFHRFMYPHGLSQGVPSDFSPTPAWWRWRPAIIVSTIPTWKLTLRTWVSEADGASGLLVGQTIQLVVLPHD